MSLLFGSECQQATACCTRCCLVPHLNVSRGVYHVGLKGSWPMWIWHVEHFYQNLGLVSNQTALYNIDISLHNWALCSSILDFLLWKLNPSCQRSFGYFVDKRNEILLLISRFVFSSVLQKYPFLTIALHPSMVFCVTCVIVSLTPSWGVR